MKIDELREILARAFRACVESVDLGGETAAFLRDQRPARAVLLAVGKSAPAMAAGAVDALGSRLREGVVVTTDGTEAVELPRVETYRAAHPLPDARSVRAADAALQLAHRAGADTCVALFSGGASSLLCAPSGALRLEDKRTVTLLLMRAGASTCDLNIVRRHLSRIKGGRLARLFAGQVITAIVRDVMGGQPCDVGSGPTCPDPTTTEQAREVLRRYLSGPVIDRFAEHMTESVAPDEHDRHRLRVREVFGPEQFAACFCSHLAKFGLHTTCTTVVHTDAEGLAQRLVQRARLLHQGQAAVVSAEPTLRVPAKHGSGGRAGWVALRAVCDLPKEVVLLCCATDGVDGSSGSAGACVSRDMADAVPSVVLANALRMRDDAAAHRLMNSHLAGGATGLNVTDLYCVARLPK